MPIPSPNKAILLAEVGDPDGSLAAIIDVLWEYWTGQVGPIDARLIDLYMKRALCEVVLGQRRLDTNFNLQGDLSDQQAARFDHAQKLYDDATVEIKRIETIVQSSRRPAVGALTTTESATPPVGAPDAHDARYAGSPYRPVPRLRP